MRRSKPAGQRLAGALFVGRLGEAGSRVASLDEVRAEAVRSRAFIRAAETQLSKVLTEIDEMIMLSGGGVVAVPAPAPVAGVAVALRVERQPAGAETDVAFATQPRVEVIDALGDRVTGSTVEITATKATGSGTLSGDTAVNAVSGLATFVDLELSGSGDHSLTFSATGLQPVTSEVFDVDVPVSELLTPVYFSDWATQAPGTSQGVYTDGGKWNAPGGSGHAIVASAGLDFPTTNVFAVYAVEARTGWCEVRKTGMSIPAVGVNRNYRWYARVVIADGVAVTDGQTHPNQDGSGPLNWGWYVYHEGLSGSGANQWTTQVKAIGSSASYTGPHLEKDATYRVDMQVCRTGTATFRMHIQIHDTSDVLLYDDGDFVTDAGGGALLSANPTFNYNNINNQGSFNAGLNGLSGSDWFASSPVLYMYEGGIAIVDGLAEGTFIGPYGSVVGES